MQIHTQETACRYDILVLAQCAVSGIYRPRDQGDQAAVYSCDDFGYG